MTSKQFRKVIETWVKNHNGPDRAYYDELLLQAAYEAAEKLQQLERAFIEPLERQI